MTNKWQSGQNTLSEYHCHNLFIYIKGITCWYLVLNIFIFQSLNSANLANWEGKPLYFCCITSVKDATLFTLYMYYRCNKQRALCYSVMFTNVKYKGGLEGKLWKYHLFRIISYHRYFRWQEIADIMLNWYKEYAG